MALYRIRFKLSSAIVTPLKGDTIWGHIVWGIANHIGDEAVAKFLEQEKAEQPALVVSSAFPAGMVCRPMSPPERKERLTKKTYAKIKEDKKIKYVSASKYFSNVEEENDDDETKTKKQDPLDNIQVMHNTIDRITNTALEERSPYSTEERWSKIPCWDLYIFSSFSTDCFQEHFGFSIKQLIQWAFENGYGADASTGKGRISEISDPFEVKPEKPKQGNIYMALGPFVEPGTALPDLRADIFVRSGKLGGAFVTSLSPYKKPVILYDEGAVFRYDESIQNESIQYVVGKLLEGMHKEDLTICQSGFAPVIPVNLKE
jgi:CRISPR-associated protein Csm4